MTNFANFEKAKEILGQVRNRIRANRFPQAQRVSYTWLDYEEDIHRLLKSYLPECVLGNVRLFTPSFLADRDFGLEVDNMFHVFYDNTDYLVLVEAKHQTIEIKSDAWLVNYGDGSKNVRDQIDGHVRALMDYLEPISNDVSFKIIYYVTTSGSHESTVTASSKHFNAELYLLSYDHLIYHINQRLKIGPDVQSENVVIRRDTVLSRKESQRVKNNQQIESLSEIGIARRISQSPYLDLLRLGYANDHLGHPEISSAVRYVERCRRELDQSLFRLFDPSPERWLINGSAGMGKSVLLAYAAAVLSSGYHLRKSVGGVGAYKAKE